MPRSPEITRAGRGSFFVPRREGLVELTDLDRWIAPLLIEEASSAGAFRKARAKADKIKIGALGNIVRQFHLHVVALLLAIALALALPGERRPRFALSTHNQNVPYFGNMRMFPAAQWLGGCG